MQAFLFLHFVQPEKYNYGWQESRVQIILWWDFGHEVAYFRAKGHFTEHKIIMTEFKI